MIAVVICGGFAAGARMGVFGINTLGVAVLPTTFRGAARSRCRWRHLSLKFAVASVIILVGVFLAFRAI